MSSAANLTGKEIIFFTIMAVFTAVMLTFWALFRSNIESQKQRIVCQDMEVIIREKHENGVPMLMNGMMLLVGERKSWDVTYRIPDTNKKYLVFEVNYPEKPTVHESPVEVVFSIPDRDRAYIWRLTSLPTKTDIINVEDKITLINAHFE